MKFSERTDFKYSTVVRHQGASIILALNENCDIYYRVLALEPTQPEDDKCWSDSKKLALPDQIRPSGMSLVTVKLKTIEKTAATPFQAVSDGKHVYLFRQSTDCTLYVDRFIFDPAQKILNPNWETRFQRSCKRDIADSRKDTTGAMGMEGEPFLEPTTELTLIKDLQDGRFSVLLLPGRLPSEWRWQIFVTNAKGEIDSFSIRRGDDGLFDMSDVKQHGLRWAERRDRFQTGPAVLMYMQQEDALDENGRNQRFKRGVRVMLTAPVGSSKYALELDGLDDFVCLGNPENLQIEGAITIEAWVKIQDTDKEQYIVVHGTNGVYLKIDSGKYQIGCQDQCASFDIPEDDINNWVHLAGVYDSEQQAWILYRNEDEVIRQEDLVCPATVEEDWMLGRYFKGQINNVRLWNIARSATEIQDNMYQPLSGQEPGLVGCWPIDEGSGDIARDVVAENHGQLDLGYALNFDGIDDYVDVADNSSLAINQAITVEARIKHLGGDGHIVNRGGGWSDSGYSLFIYQGNIRVELQDTSRREKTIVDNPLPTGGTWHHLTFTWDSTSEDIKTYIDGKLQPNTGKFTGPIGMPGQNLNIGRNEKHGYYFHGSIDKVCLWNVARTQEDIQQGMDVPPAGDESGLVGYWPFEERSGDIVRDVASENDGQLHLGYAIDFDGLDDYVELPEMNPDYNEGFTVEAWVRYNSFQPHSRIIDFGNGQQQDNILFYNGGETNNLEFHVFQGKNGKAIIAKGILEKDIWIHLAATVDRYGNAVLYKNGEQLQTGTINVPATLNRTKNYIGRSNWVGDGYFDGCMKEVRIWNVARTQEEIQRDMHGPPAEDEPGLVGWWVPLNEGSGNTIHDKAQGKHGMFHVGYRKDSRALAFDGVDDYVELSEMDHNYDNGFTVEAWVRFSNFKLNSRIIDFGRGSPQDNIIFANHGDSRNLMFQVYQDQTIKEIIAPDVLQENEWMHLATTVDNIGNAVIYVNGHLQVTGSIHKPLTVNRNMNYIGRSNWAQDGYFNGSMGEVRIWNVARSETEIQANMHKLLSGKEEDLVGYWPLNEGSGSTIHDQTSKNTDGTFRVGSDDDPDSKWGEGPILIDNVDEKWVEEGPDKADEKWGKGPDDPKNKWVVVPPIVVLDFGVSRDGTLALIGPMENHSELILARKDDNNTADLSIPVLDKSNSQMGVIKVDQKGLTVSAGLLDYAHTGDTPFLLDGSDGLIHLYFRGDYSNFLVTQLNTLTARVTYTLPLNGNETTDSGPQLYFVARQSGTQMQGYKISIVDGSSSDYCLVTMDSQNGIKEEWKEVPRHLELFLAVINGTAPRDANDPLVEEDKLYDYSNNVKREGLPDLTTGSNPFFGSTLFGVTADNLPDPGEPLPKVPNIESAKMAENGLDCAWIPEPMGKALQFDGMDDYVELPHEKVAIAGDMTLEAWVKINEKNSSTHQRLINYHSGDMRFALGLVKNDNNYNVFAGCGEKLIQTDQIRWTARATLTAAMTSPLT